MKTKTCSTCGVEKPLDDFHKSNHRASGRQSSCKACRCDFDHRPDEKKEFGISKARQAGYSLKRIATEIAKCDLVCANCHRVRTFLRYANRAEGVMV